MGAADARVDGATGGDWDLRSQLPAGAWDTVTDVSWSTTTPDGWGVATNRPGPPPSIIEDTSAPDGDPFVLRQPYGGTGDGEEPQFPFCYWPASNEVYVGMLVRFAPSWEQPATSGVKWHIFEGMPNELPGWVGLGAGMPPGSPRTGFTFNYGAATGVPDDRNLPTVGSPRSFERGRWHKLQYLVRADPPRVAVWLDDTVLVDSDMEGAFSWAEPGQRFTGLQMGATWGGGIGYVAPDGNVIDYAHTLILRRE